MKTAEVATLSATDVHEALNDFVKKHTGKMAGRVQFERSTVGQPVCFMNELAATVELVSPPTRN